MHQFIMFTISFLVRRENMSIVFSFFLLFNYTHRTSNDLPYKLVYSITFTNKRINLIDYYNILAEISISVAIELQKVI